MENKKGTILFFSIIAAIVGAALYKQFDLENLKFEKTGLAIIYLIVFIASVYFIIKNLRNSPTK